MAMAGGCMGMGNAGGVTVNNVIGRGLLPRERRTPPPSWARDTPWKRDLPRERLFQKSGNGVARTNDARMRHHCPIFERGTSPFQSISTRRAGGGSALWRNWQVGRWCAMDGALLNWREGFGTARKKRTTAGPKKQKARQTVALAQKKERMPPPNLSCFFNSDTVSVACLN